MSKHKIEAKFLELLNMLPSLKSRRELDVAMLKVCQEMSERLLKLGKGEHIPITATAAYISKTLDIHLSGCTDIEMASLSAKTQMIEKFEKGLDEV